MTKPVSPHGSVSQVLQDIGKGGDAAFEEIWQRYFPRLVRVARNSLRNLPHRLHDAEDAAQSAFVSFWKKLDGNDIAPVLDRTSLWRLLATITVRKARRIRSIK